MKIELLFLFIVSTLICHQGITQDKAKADPITGTWRGSSLCQVKDSPCHDEIAVYHATKQTATTYQFQMNKMVNGKEEEMGPLVFTWNETRQTLTAINHSSRGDGHWTFQLKGNTMHGTLTVENNTLYRIIDLKKE